MKNRFFDLIFSPPPSSEAVDIDLIKSEFSEFIKSPPGIGYSIGAMATGIAGLIFMIALDKEMRKKSDPSSSSIRVLSAFCISAGTLLLAHRVGTVGAIAGAGYMAAKEAINGNSNPLLSCGIFGIITGGCYLAAKDVYKTLVGRKMTPGL